MIPGFLLFHFNDCSNCKIKKEQNNEDIFFFSPLHFYPYSIYKIQYNKSIISYKNNEKKGIYKIANSN